MERGEVEGTQWEEGKWRVHNGERGSGGYIMERGEVEGTQWREGKWRVGDQQATVKAMTGVLHPWCPHFKYIKPGTLVTTVWDDMIG